MTFDSYGSTRGMGMGGSNEFGSGGAIGAGDMGPYGPHGRSGMGGNQGGSGIGGSYGKSGIGGGYGSSFRNGGSSGSASSMGSRSGSLGGLKLRYSVSWDFSKTSQELSLADGDRIRMDKRCNQDGLSEDVVRIALKLRGVTWWKGLYKCSEFDSSSVEKFGVQDQQNVIKYKDITVPFLSHYRWALGKAKIFGRHFSMYYILNRESMQGGCSYLF